jgi:arylformamidase
MATGKESSDWIDISIPYRKGMLYWPTDAPPRVERIKDVDSGDNVTLTEMTIISHTGTHIDAPLHFIPGGGTIDQMPLDTAIGPARVIEIEDQKIIRPEELAKYNIQKGERILFKTRNSDTLYQTDEFKDDYVYFSNETADYLVEKGIRLVGLDYISIGTLNDNANIHTTHRALLGHGIYILENINLAGVKPGQYELIAVPIKLERGDAGPCRAIIRSL